ncbi:MAG: flagellar type III secretion system pore protein FliP [Deltaproteobacteria bacterium]
MNSRLRFVVLIMLIMVLFMTIPVSAEPALQIPKIGIDIGPAKQPQEAASTVQIILLLTVLSIAPAILIMMTSFTRIIIILSFLRSALGTQQMPPNQVLIGFAMFLTFFIMSPVFIQINDQAYKPFMKGQISQDIAFSKAETPIKDFMLKQIKSDKDLLLFIKMAKMDPTKVEKAKLPLTVVIPAFMINELKVAFQIGFLLFIPFLVIDMVVSSTLMAMGMMMLPPVMISLPFKLLLFIMVDGWNLITQTIVMGFR